MDLTRINFKYLRVSSRGLGKEDGVLSVRYEDNRCRQGEGVGMKPVGMFMNLPDWVLFTFPRKKQSSICQVPTKVQCKYILLFF